MIALAQYYRIYDLYQKREVHKFDTPVGRIWKKIFFLSCLNKHHNDSQPTFQFTTNIQEITRRNLNLGEKETFAVHQTYDFFP